MSQEKFEALDSIENESINPREVIDGLEIMLERLIDMPDLPEGHASRLQTIRGYSDSMARMSEEEDNQDGFDSAQTQFYAELKKFVEDESFWSDIDVVPSDIDTIEVSQTFLSDIDGFLPPDITPEEKAHLIEKAEEDVNGTPVATFRKKLKILTNKLGKMILMSGDGDEDKISN